MMHKKRWAALVLAAALALTGCSFGGVGGGGSTAQKIDRSAVESAELQFTHPAAGDTVAVFDTSAGVFRAVLFPDKAPQAYDNFVGLVQAGYYNGLTVSRVESGFVVEAGQGADGRGSTIWNGRRPPARGASASEAPAPTRLRPPTACTIIPVPCAWARMLPASVPASFTWCRPCRESSL